MPLYIARIDRLNTYTLYYVYIRQIRYLRESQGNKSICAEFSSVLQQTYMCV